MSDITGTSKVGIGDASFTEIFRTFPESVVSFESSQFSEITQARAGEDPVDVVDVLDSQYIRNTKLGVTLGDSLTLSDVSSSAGTDVILSDGFFIPESDYVQVRLQLLNNGLNVTGSIASSSTITLEHLTTLPNNDLNSYPIKTFQFDGSFSSPNQGDILFTFNKPQYKTNLRVSANVNSPYGTGTLEMLSIINAPSVNLPALPQELEQIWDDPDWTEPDFAPGSPGPVPEAIMVLAEFDLTPNVLDAAITYAGGGNRFVFNAGPPETLDFQIPDEMLFNGTRLAEKKVTNLFENGLASIDANHNPTGFVLNAGSLLVSSTLESNLTSKANTYVATFRNTQVVTGRDTFITLTSSAFVSVDATQDITISGWLGIENLDDGSELERTTVAIDYYNPQSTQLFPSTTTDLDIDNDLLLQTFAVSETTIPAGTTKIKFRFEMASLDTGDSIKFRLLLPQVVQLGQATSDIFGIQSRNADVWTIPQADNITPVGGTIAVTVIGGGTASVGTLFDTTDPLTGQDGFKLTYDGTNWTFSIDDAGTTVTVVGADASIPEVPTVYVVEWNQAANSRRIWRDDVLIINDDTTVFTTPTVMPTNIYIGSNSSGTDQPNVVLQQFNVMRRATRGGVSINRLFSDTISLNDLSRMTITPLAAQGVMTAGTHDWVINIFIANFGNSQNTHNLGQFNSSNIFDNGFFFPSVGIPVGVTITIAYLIFNPSTSTSGTVARWNINVENDTTPTLIVSEPDYQSRVFLASVPWDGAGTWTTDVKEQSVSIVTPIQTLIDTVGWSDGNAIQIVVAENGSDSGSHRTYDTYDGDVNLAVQLHVEYTLP